MKIRRSKVLFPFGLFISFWALLITNLCTPISAVAANITLREGTPVVLRLEKSIDSELANVGDPVDLVIARDVEIKGVVVIRQGTKGLGEVVSVEKKGAIGKPGKIMIAVKSTTAVDGTKVPLRATLSREGKSKETAALAVGILICILGLLIKGESAEIPAGTEIKAYVDLSVDITI